MRLIDADALAEIWRHEYDRLGWFMEECAENGVWGARYGAKIERNTIAEFVLGIDEAPTIDAEPIRHGKWENGKCSICNRMSVTRVTFKGETVFEDTFEFCPHCGARMDGGDAE